jgi:hypothetical protein
MGPVSQAIKTYGRRAGYKVGGVGGSMIGKMTGTSVGERLGRRAGHKLGKAVGVTLGTLASKSYSKIPIIGSMSKGGPIHRTGVYRLHKGEYVVSKAKAKRIHTMLRGRKRR